MTIPLEAASPRAAFAPPTPEMVRWKRRLQSTVYGDHLAGRALRFALVTPLAHVANLSFDYQAYLYAVFHRRLLTRWSHRLLIPIATAASLGALMRLDATLGAALAGGLVAWYVVQGLYNGMAALAGVMALLGVAAALAGEQWYRASLAGPWWMHPGLWVVALAGVMTLTHAGEPDVPPRTSGEDHWMPMSAFFRRRPSMALLRSAASFVSGMLNEIWGAWRLFPVLVAEGLWRGGYQPQRYERLRDQVRRALAGGNPALDYVGHGGGGAPGSGHATAPTGPAPEEVDLAELVAHIRRDLDRDDWRLERERAGVTVLSHPDLDAPVVGFRTVVEVDADLDEVTRFLGPGLLDAFSRMNELYVDGHVLEKREAADVVRTRFAMPWPMKGREFVHLLHVARPSDDERVVAYRGVDGPSLPSPSEGYVRCPVYPSGQRLTRLADGRTRVEHLMVYALAGNIPIGIQNRLFHRGHVGAYETEWRGLIAHFDDGEAG